jgi:DNA-binding MarR family transcriptional regulator
MQEQSSFFAILPAHVRYDQDLSGDEKVLYAEISALTKKYGFCYASNAYFARVFHVNKRTVVRWLNQLILKGYIIKELDEPFGRRKLFLDVTHKVAQFEAIQETQTLGR